MYRFFPSSVTRLCIKKTKKKRSVISGETAERSRKGRCSPCSRRPRSKRIAGSRLLLDPFRAALRAHLKGCLTRSLIYATKSLAAPLRRGLDLLPVRGEKTNRPKLRSVRPAPPPLPPYFVLHSAPVFPSNEQFLVQQRLGDRLIRTGLWRVQTVLLPGCERRDQSSDCQDVLVPASLEGRNRFKRFV